MEYSPDTEIQLLQNMTGDVTVYHFVQKFDSLGDYYNKVAVNPPSKDVQDKWTEAFKRNDGEGEFLESRMNFIRAFDVEKL